MVRALSVVVVLAVIALSAAAQPPPALRSPLTRPAQPAVALTALAQPLAATSTAATPVLPPDLVGQQINFHINLLVDFVATGSQLVGRQLTIPAALIRDIQNGVPLVDAASRALVEFANIELDAGRELVGFAVSYLDFQVRFVAATLRDIAEVASSVFVGPAMVSPRPASPSRATAAVNASPSAAASDIAPSTRDDTVQAIPASKVTAFTTAEHPKKPKPAVVADGSVAATAIRAQGEVRSAATEQAETDAATGDGVRHSSKAGKQDKDDSHDAVSPNSSEKANAVR